MKLPARGRGELSVIVRRFHAEPLEFPGATHAECRGSIFYVQRWDAPTGRRQGVVGGILDASTVIVGEVIENGVVVSVVAGKAPQPDPPGSGDDTA